MLTSKKARNTTSFLGRSNGNIELSLRPFGWFAEDLEIDFLKSKFNKIWKNRSQYKNDILEKIPPLRELACRIGDEAKKMIINQKN